MNYRRRDRSLEHSALVENMDKSPSTCVCANCGAKFIYHEYDQTNHPDPATGCPACEAIVPELRGAKIVAFFRKPKAKTV
jgi:hypothetical protein